MFALEKSIPNETGINMSSVEGFIKRLNNAQIPMHSILLMHKGKLITNHITETVFTECFL